MKLTIFFVLSLVVFSTAVAAQNAPATGTDASTSTTTPAKPKRVVFRANKDQITLAQQKLKAEASYTGEQDGRMNPDFRNAVRSYQGSNGLRRTGSLNRATLEKMGIALTEAQKLIPIPENSYAAAEGSATDKPKRGPVFRATKDQINEAQRKLKAANMYAGEETGQLSQATREGLKKYQEANGLKVTGTLNQATLEKMGIVLTDRQKANAAAASAAPAKSN
jgi:peptidoglycan hydrolase-like protein with peptidoglycan-binding domain